MALAVGVTPAANLAAGVIAARLHGSACTRRRTSASPCSRGEFSLILASLAAASGLDGRLSPFTAGYVLVLALIGPLAALRSDLLTRGLAAKGRPRPPHPS